MRPHETSHDAPPTRVPRLALTLLGFGTFAVGTGSYVYLGLLSALAADMGVTIQTAGLLATAFAAGYALGAPFLVTLSENRSPTRLLLASMFLFAIIQLLSGLVDSFGLLVGLRVLAALAGGFYTPTALASGVGLVPAEKRGIALAAVMGGLTLSFLVGIPIGSVLGGLFGWRATFFLASGLAAVSAILLLFLVHIEPRGHAGASVPAALRVPAVRSDLAVTMLGFIGAFAVVAFIGPLLETYGQLGPNGIALLQAGSGLGGLLGTAAGGVFADREGTTGIVPWTLIATALALFSMVLLGPLTQIGTGYAVALAALALFVGSAAVFALVPLQQHRLIHHAPDKRGVVLSLNQSAIFLGQGLGAVLGSVVISRFPLSALGGAAGSCLLVALAIAWPRKSAHR